MSAARRWACPPPRGPARSRSGSGPRDRLAPRLRRSRPGSELPTRHPVLPTRWQGPPSVWPASAGLPPGWRGTAHDRGRFDARPGRHRGRGPEPGPRPVGKATPTRASAIRSSPGRGTSRCSRRCPCPPAPRCSSTSRDAADWRSGTGRPTWGLLATSRWSRPRACPRRQRSAKSVSSGTPRSRRKAARARQWLAS